MRKVQRVGVDRENEKIALKFKKNTEKTKRMEQKFEGICPKGLAG